MGLTYIASYNRSKGLHVRFIDMDPMEIGFEKLKEMIKEKKPAIVGISFMTNQFGNALKVARLSKETDPSLKVVVGGNHASGLPDELVETGVIDYVVVAEGELTSYELFSSILNKNDEKERSSIKGIVYREGEKNIHTEKRELIENLDSLPFPLWEGIPHEKYSEKVIGSKKEGSAFSIMSTRGCPAKCTFCSSHTVFTHAFRYRSPENVVKEMVWLNEKYGATQFNFVDDTFTVNKGRVIRICDLLIEGKYDFEWIANARVNTVNLKLLEKMKKAGCRNINYGVESGDPEVRLKLAKGVTTEQIIEAHQWAKKAGLVVSTYFMIGNHGESKKSIEMTIDFAKSLETDYPSCSIATPYPDTAMYYAAKEKGWIKTYDWDRYYTTPHLLPDYKPVAVNGILSQEEILEGYYYINRKFLNLKLKTRYGNLFFLNPSFYKNEVLKRMKERGIGNFFILMKKLFNK